MYQLSKVLIVLMCLCVIPNSGHTQAEFDQRIDLKGKSLRFLTADGNIRNWLQLDNDENFWINPSIEIKKNSGNLHVHSGDLYIEGSTGQIHSDPDDETSNLELVAKSRVIAVIDADQSPSEPVDHGRFVVKSGAGHESVWVTEGGGLIVWQETDPIWKGFGNSTELSGAGIDIVQANGERAELYSAGGDLSFAFDGIDQSYIRESDGKYFNASNVGSGGAIVSNNNKSSGNVISKVMALPLRKSTQKNASHDLEMNTKVLSQLFPKTVDEKAGEYAVSYSDFGLIAIKAIQEQQAMIDELRVEIMALKDKE